MDQWGRWRSCGRGWTSTAEVRVVRGRGWTSTAEVRVVRGRGWTNTAEVRVVRTLRRSGMGSRWGVGAWSLHRQGLSGVDSYVVRGDYEAKYIPSVFQWSGLMETSTKTSTEHNSHHRYSQTEYNTYSWLQSPVAASCFVVDAAIDIFVMIE